MDSLPEYESWIENTLSQNFKTSFLYFITANISIKKSRAAEFYFILFDYFLIMIVSSHQKLLVLSHFFFLSLDFLIDLSIF